MRTPDRLVLLYLAAIILANLLVSHYGPAVSVFNAFLLIGLDLSIRDRVHEQWQGHDLGPRMLGLIAAGGILSLLLGGSGRIALASCLTFILAGIADTLVYRGLARRPWLTRANGSNLSAAVVDSLWFPVLAFGWPPLWGVVFGQFIAKVAGGALWAWVIARCRSEARVTAERAPKRCFQLSALCFLLSLPLPASDDASLPF